VDIKLQSQTKLAKELKMSYPTLKSKLQRARKKCFLIAVTLKLIVRGRLSSLLQKIMDVKIADNLFVVHV